MNHSAPKKDGHRQGAERSSDGARVEACDPSAKEGASKYGANQGAASNEAQISKRRVTWSGIGIKRDWADFFGHWASLLFGCIIVSLYTLHAGAMRVSKKNEAYGQAWRALSGQIDR